MTGPMTGRAGPHGPNEADPKFVEFLEWQLASELRRAATLEAAPAPGPAPIGRRKGTRMIWTLALMIASTLVGATGAISIVQQVDQEHRKLMVMKAEIHLEQATAHLEQAVEQMEEAMPLFEGGYISESEMRSLRQGVEQAESERRSRELDLRETRVTGRDPRNDLGAPVVDGVDYVMERLQAQLAVIRSELERRVLVLRQTDALAERGFISTTELERDRQHVMQAEAHVEIVERRMRLRQKFVAGEVSREAVELRDMAETAAGQFQDARIALEAAARFHRRISDQYEAAATTRSELREAEARVRAAEAQHRLAELEVRIVRRQLEMIEQERERDHAPNRGD